MPSEAAHIAGASNPLARAVMERSGQNLFACYQCRKCAAGCPVADEAGMAPDRLIRTILLGGRDEAINNLLVWKCVACYTCGARCPNGIQTARVNETLKQMSKEAHAGPMEPRIAAFHEAFMKSASHFGRLNEVELMGIYETGNAARALRGGKLRAFLTALGPSLRLGLSMARKKRMHFGLAGVKRRSEIKALYKKSEQERQQRAKKEKI